MTIEEAYELMQKQNWYKLFLEEVSVNPRRVVFNHSYRNGNSIHNWVDNALYWDDTRQG